MQSSHSHLFLHPKGTWGRRQATPVMCSCEVDIPQTECSPAQWQIKELLETHRAQQAWEIWRGWYWD